MFPLKSQDGESNNLNSSTTPERKKDRDNDLEIVSANLPTFKSHAGSGRNSLSSRPQRSVKCACCGKMAQVKHEISLEGRINKLCSDDCFTRFQEENSLSLKDCGNCQESLMLVGDEPSHSLVINGKEIVFCNVTCVNNYKAKHNSLVSCAWCHVRKSRFSMIENKEKENTGEYSVFCTLNCLSLYRVNKQATCKSSVRCDQCNSVAPAQYHLTMSDASVRNFCSYTCVVSYQGQYAKSNSDTNKQKQLQKLQQHQQQQKQQAAAAQLAAQQQAKMAAARGPSRSRSTNVHRG